jgi:hypothetical protein
MPPKSTIQVIQHGLDENINSAKIGIFKATDDDTVLLNCALLFTGAIKNPNNLMFEGAAGIAYFKARGCDEAKRENEPTKQPFSIFEGDLKSDTALRHAMTRNFPHNTVVCKLTVSQFQSLWDAQKLTNQTLKVHSLVDRFGFFEDGNNGYFFFNGHEKLHITGLVGVW